MKRMHDNFVPSPGDDDELSFISRFRLPALLGVRAKNSHLPVASFQHSPRLLQALRV
jgi:hypothetical protein